MYGIFRIFTVPKAPPFFSSQIITMIFLHRVTIKPYLLKYMAHYVKIEPHFRVSEKNRFGAFLINSLRHKSQLFKHDHKSAVTGVPLLVGIPEIYELQYGIIISEKHQYRFNNFLFNEFTDRMLDYVVPKLTGKKGDVKRELLNFRASFDICEDELPYKTLEKQWERCYYCATACKSA